MEEEKEIIKPPLPFTVLLYFYFMLTVWSTWLLVDGLNDSWCDSISQIAIRDVIILSVLGFGAYFFSLIAICKALQRRSYSIVMLKFSAFYMVIRILLCFNGNILLLVLLLSLALFLLYLYRSKGVKSYIPPENRTFGKYGVIGLGLNLMLVLTSVYIAGEQIYKNHNSLPHNPSGIQLAEGEETDGLVIFKPLQSWMKDTVVPSPEGVSLYQFNKGNSAVVSVEAFIADCNNRIDYCAILSQRYHAEVPDTVFAKEVTFNDSIINGNRFYSTTFEIEGWEATPLYWTFAALASNDSYKIITLSYKEPSTFGNSVNESLEFMSDVKFSLK